MANRSTASRLAVNASICSNQTAGWQATGDFISKNGKRRILFALVTRKPASR